MTERCFTGQQDKEDPDEFVGSGENSLLEGKPVFDPFAVIDFEEIIELDNPERHEPDDPSEIPVAPLGNPAVPFVLAGLIDRRMETGHGNQLVVGFKILYLTSHLDQEFCGRLVPNPPGRGEDLDILLQCGLTELDQGVGNLLHVLLVMNQDQCFLPPDKLPGRICRSHGRLGNLQDCFSRHRRIPPR
jgi:hypothetical protein